MGYIKSIELMAFLTQKGKSYFFDTNKKKRLITHYSLSDPDTNYLIASSTTINTVGVKNILPNYFVPNLSGVYGSEDSCLRYLANGITQSNSLSGGDCDIIGEYINDDLSVTCVQEFLPILFFTAENYVSFGGEQKDYTYNTTLTGLTLDYVYSSLKNKAINEFDINLRYYLLDSDTSHSLFKEKPNGNEMFKFIFNYINEVFLQKKDILDNILVSNELLTNGQPNLFALVNNEILSNKNSGCILYLEKINTNSILQLEKYGWNTVLDVDTIPFKKLKGVTNTPNRSVSYQTVNKKIRFYKPTSVGIRQISPLAQGNLLNLGTYTSSSNKSKITFTVSYEYFLNSASPEGLEVLRSLLSTNTSQITNLRFKHTQNNTDVINFNTNIDSVIKDNIDIEFDFDDTGLSAGFSHNLNLVLNINVVNDFVLKNENAKSIIFGFNYLRQSPPLPPYDTNNSFSVEYAEFENGATVFNPNLIVTENNVDNFYADRSAVINNVPKRIIPPVFYYTDNLNVFNPIIATYDKTSKISKLNLNGYTLNLKFDLTASPQYPTDFFRGSIGDSFTVDLVINNNVILSKKLFITDVDKKLTNIFQGIPIQKDDEFYVQVSSEQQVNMVIEDRERDFPSLNNRSTYKTPFLLSIIRNQSQ